ncbi:hypothetical protein CCR75_003485 [Bremia lactucae]|uniref:Cleavage and polyadenylation specificity factor subunit 4 n=1 Tax=Bremia lactucae TaxID=4779 RepID=A0A976FR71_BRELC|nr:hypothetical protein CCR75_003485 [Bremia lactucae]
MVLGLLLRDEEERHLSFDFESILPEDGDERMDLGEHRSGAIVGVGGATFGQQAAKKDFKRGTVVCRHWLRALCMKGDNCEFLHQYDMSKMPECRWGMECQVPECPFRHVPDEERVECAFYKQGFCSHGSSCRYRHIKLAREECPETADFALQAKAADEENVKRRKAQPVNEFFKIAICKHWEKMGSCPFGDECHFAHGDTELRPFPKGEKEENDARGRYSGLAGPEGGARGQVGPASSQLLPDEGKMAKYYVVHAASYMNLAHSVHYKRWAVPSTVLQQFKMALEGSYDVFLVFTIRSSKQYQGLARVLTEACSTINPSLGTDLSINSVPYEVDGKCEWTGAFPIEWLYSCECPWERLAQCENKQLAVMEW